MTDDRDRLNRVDDPLIRLELEWLLDQREEHARRREQRRPEGYWIAHKTDRWEAPRAAVWHSALVWVLRLMLEMRSGRTDPVALLAACDEDGYDLAELLLDWELRPDRYPELSDGEVRLLAGVSAVSLVDEVRELLEAEVEASG